MCLHYTITPFHHSIITSYTITPLNRYTVTPGHPDIPAPLHHYTVQCMVLPSTTWPAPVGGELHPLAKEGQGGHQEEQVLGRCRG